MAEKFAFLDVFPCCAAVSELCGGLQNAYLNSVLVDKESRTILVDGFFSRMPAPAETRILEDRLCAEFGLAQAEVRADYPRVSAPAPTKEAKGGSASKQTVLMGKAIKSKPVSMDTLNLESGSVTVSGRVFATDSREIAKRQAAVLSFCITDDEVCREAACQEIIRRFLIAECDYKKGKISAEQLDCWSPATSRRRTPRPSGRTRRRKSAWSCTCIRAFPPWTR